MHEPEHGHGFVMTVMVATPEAEASPIVSTDEELESEPTDEQSTADILDEITGQMKLFDE